MCEKTNFSFTFQYGEIKSGKPSQRAVITNIFTFQYGEIKRLQPGKPSTLVLQFTFQYGEIKSLARDLGIDASNTIYIPVWRD